MYLGPSSTRRATDSGRQRPSPALSVSCSCRPISSSSLRATAMPPCAQAVAESLRLDLARTKTLPALLGSMAARIRATPEPTSGEAAWVGGGQEVVGIVSMLGVCVY